MATKQEIIQAIQQGIDKVDATFSGLSEDQLATKVHADKTDPEARPGWSAREILAHLASRDEAYNLMFHLAEGGEPPAAGSFNVDEWNQRGVDARINKSKDELLAEFREVHERLIERVKALPDEVLDHDVPTPSGTRTVAQVLMGSGGMHSVMHADEVDEALALTP